ncbi:hypothetical protein EX30DRAFT_367106 [Ascodesmis nigricans]|uniref:Uncharacterized protein n=1 Tax=Ascodesmis nigricans TaxID=341454 RepID=A0A4S2MIS7_9PEZI|nr:hypothetical protein EX30DRAFT_367106 [Ascodesmis nigricans]
MSSRQPPSPPYTHSILAPRCPLVSLSTPHRPHLAPITFVRFRRKKSIEIEIRERQEMEKIQEMELQKAFAAESVARESAMEMMMPGLRKKRGVGNLKEKGEVENEVKNTQGTKKETPLPQIRPPRMCIGPGPKPTPEELVFYKARMQQNIAQMAPAKASPSTLPGSSYLTLPPSISDSKARAPVTWFAANAPTFKDAKPPARQSVPHKPIQRPVSKKPLPSPPVSKKPPPKKTVKKQLQPPAASTSRAPAPTFIPINNPHTPAASHAAYLARHRALLDQLSNSHLGAFSDLEIVHLTRQDPVPLFPLVPVASVTPRGGGVEQTPPTSGSLASQLFSNMAPLPPTLYDHLLGQLLLRAPPQDPTKPQVMGICTLCSLPLSGPPRAAASSGSGSKEISLGPRKVLHLRTVMPPMAVVGVLHIACAPVEIINHLRSLYQTQVSQIVASASSAFAAVATEIVAAMKRLITTPDTAEFASESNASTHAVAEFFTRNPLPSPSSSPSPDTSAPRPPLALRFDPVGRALDTLISGTLALEPYRRHILFTAHATSNATDTLLQRALEAAIVEGWSQGRWAQRPASGGVGGAEREKEGMEAEVRVEVGRRVVEGVLGKIRGAVEEGERRSGRNRRPLITTVRRDATPIRAPPRPVVVGH